MNYSYESSNNPFENLNITDIFVEENKLFILCWNNGVIALKIDQNLAYEYLIDFSFTV